MFSEPGTKRKDVMMGFADHAFTKLTLKSSSRPAKPLQHGAKNLASMIITNELQFNLK